MAVFRVNKTEDYTIISNHHLKNKEMSLEAKGLLSLMLSLPDDWDYSVDGLVSQCKENDKAISSILKELKSFGHLRVDKLMPNQTESGRIEYVYNIFEFPALEKQDPQKQGVEFQEVEKQAVERQDLENGSLILNTNIQNTNNKKENITLKEKRAKEIRHKHGVYGRVLLTEAEYDRLLNELGKDKLEKQIELLDEYIESNNNKNKYTNFNLVLRKSIKENWFNNNRNNYNQPRQRVSDPDWLREYEEHFMEGVEEL